MPKTSTPVLFPFAVAITCPFTRGAARVTPGIAAIRSASASKSRITRVSCPFSS